LRLLKMYKILNSDIFAALNSLDDRSIDIAITSPPYWSQRDYGFDIQIGNEKTYQEYIGCLIKNFEFLKSKLCEKGVFFLNIGDKYLKNMAEPP